MHYIFFAAYGFSILFCLAKIIFVIVWDIPSISTVLL